MQNVQEIARAIVAREGGFVNHPNDPGGATNLGVTIATLRRLGMDLDGDQDVDIDDLKLLSKAQAVQVFVDHYYKRPNIDLLPVALQATVFDMYVNAGNRAVKILQTLAGKMGEPLKVDGGLGPKTAAAIHRLFERWGLDLVEDYGRARRAYYYRLADQKPKLRVFATSNSGGKGGWIKRAEEFISPRYHLTDAEHRARVKSWG